ncbi:MAG: hypothetical protein Fur0039_05530 [Rhodocyclaceae bacterium]
MSEPSDPLHEIPDQQAIAAELRAQLACAKRLREAARADAPSACRRLALREWQALRLARTHRDLLEDTRYGPAAAFFLSDLYGPKDFAERDAEVERILPSLVAWLPAAALRTLALAIEMDALSERLDAATARALARNGGEAEIDEAAYARAYRAAGNRAARIRQIELIGEVGASLERLTHSPLLAGILRMMRVPAHLAGLGALQEFLERGFAAFRSMNGAEEFIRRISSRETAILERLFSGRPRPFDQD